jgi:hypothetical protein
MSTKRQSKPFELSHLPCSRKEFIDHVHAFTHPDAQIEEVDGPPSLPMAIYIKFTLGNRSWYGSADLPSLHAAAQLAEGFKRQVQAAIR